MNCSTESPIQSPHPVHLKRDRDEHMQTEVICETCKSWVATWIGNSTNLYCHLKTKHSNLYQLCLAEKSSSTDESTHIPEPNISITSNFNRLTPYPASSWHHREITKAMPCYLAKDIIPAASAPSPSAPKHLLWYSAIHYSFYMLRKAQHFIFCHHSWSSYSCNCI